MIKYHIRGNENGKLIIWINGAAVGPWMWERQIDAFKDYKSVIFDLPGHGENSNRDFQTIDGCCKDIEAIILKESSEGKGILIGLSIGAQIILNMVKCYSDTLEKCVVISGLNKPIKLPKWAIRATVASSMPLVKLRFFSKLQAGAIALPDDMFELYYKDSLKITKETLYNVLCANMSFSFDEELQKSLPTLHLVGEKEKKIMFGSMAKSLSRCSNSCGYVVRDAGHGIPYEQPRVFNKAVLAFLQEREIKEKGMYPFGE